VELTVPLTPAGKPDSEMATLPLNPLIGVIEIVVSALFPWEIVRLAGEAEIEKDAGLPLHSHVCPSATEPSVVHFPEAPKPSVTGLQFAPDAWQTNPDFVLTLVQGV
jgi:hypothetical protein